MTLDEALRISPLGHAYNPKLTVGEMGFAPADNDAMPYVMDRRRVISDVMRIQPTNIPRGSLYLPFSETRKHPIRKIHEQHPGWIPVLVLDPILNIGSLDQAAGSNEVEPEA